MGSTSSTLTEDAPPSYDTVMRQDLEASVNGAVKDSSLTAGRGEAQVKSEVVLTPLAPLPSGRGGGRGSVPASASAKSPLQQPPPKAPLSSEVIKGAVVGDLIFPGFGFILGPYLSRKSTSNSEPPAPVVAAATSKAAVANVTASSESQK